MQTNMMQDEVRPEVPQVQQMPVNTQNTLPPQMYNQMQDHYKPQKEKKKGRFRRVVRGYFLTAGCVATFALVVYGLLCLLEIISPL